MTVVVGEELAGSRLDVALATLLDITRSQASARIDAGLVTVEGRQVNRGHRVRAGERIGVDEPPDEPSSEPPALPPIRYEDEHLLVLAKPPGLVVHPGPGHPDGTLVDALLAAGFALAPRGGEGRPGIVHRLDRDTSGLLVVALSDSTHEGLVAALRDRRVTRRYLALVAGVPASERGRIEAPIGRDPRDRKRFAVVADGKPATTRYVTLAAGRASGLEPARSEVALLACKLETGRTHQVRVHLTGIGHPIVGDPTYGPRTDLARAVRLERPFLHAAALSFAHPVTGAEVEVTEPLPDDLLGALDRAGIARGDAHPGRT